MNNNGKIKITDALLMAYVNGELNDATRQEVEKWMEASSVNKDHFEKIVKAWEMSATVKPKPVVVDTDRAWNTVRNKIEDRQVNVIPMKPQTNRRIYFGIAAMIVVLLGVFSILKLTAEPETVTTFAQNVGLVDKLSDGSTVTLNANSSITYPKTFATNERRINLEGEAFFEVERNEEKPFIVDLPNAAYVKVLGTSFNIKATTEDSIAEVFVNTGKVEFGSGQDSIILVAGEKGILNHNTGRIQKISDQSLGVKELLWKEKEIEFHGIPLTEVVSILNELYTEQVVLNCSNTEGLIQESRHSKESDLKDIVEVLRSTHDLQLTEKRTNGKKEYILDCNDN